MGRIHVAAFLGDVQTVGAYVNEDANLVYEAGPGDETPLHLAAQNGHMELVKWLVQHPLVPGNARDEFHRTPLHVAAFYGRADVVRELLNKPDVDPNCRDGLLRSPFHMAASEGHEEVLRQLSHRSQKQGLDEFERTALHLACLNGHENVVEWLVNEAKLPITSRDRFGFTPVHLAAFKGRRDVLEKLMKHGDCMAALEMQLEDGSTPLHLAAKMGHAEVVKLLCEKRIDVNSRTTSERFTPLHLAANGGYDEVTQCLTQRKDVRLELWDVLGRTALHYAAREGREVAVKTLLACPTISIDAKDASGFTPLHLAARGGHTKVVRMLLTNGANVNLEAGVSSVLKNLLHVAWSNGELLVSPMLLDPDFGSSAKMTALHFAARNGHMSVVRELLQFENIEVFAKDAAGLRPQDWAEVMNCRKEFVSCLESAGVRCQPFRLTKERLTAWREEREMEELAFSHLLSKRPDTAAGLAGSGFLLSGRKSEIGLHWAASRGHRDMVEQLLAQHEVDVNGQDVLGNTPLHLAAKHGHTSVVELLVKRNSVNPNVENRDGKTPLVLAFDGNHVESCRMILKKEVDGHLNWLLRMAIERDWFDMATVLVGDGRTRVLEEGVMEGKTPLEVAMSQPKRQRYVMLLLRRPEVKKQLLEERRSYMDSANAILVGAALIASVTYQGWLQPPQGPRSWARTLFWWMNAFSFYSAVATMIAGAAGSMPTSKTQLVKAVGKARRAVALACVLLATSAACVVWAFASAGFAMAWGDTSLVAELGVGASSCMLLLLWFLLRFLKLMRHRTWWQVITQDFTLTHASNEKGSSSFVSNGSGSANHECQIDMRSHSWKERIGNLRQRDQTPVGTLRKLLTEVNRIQNSARWIPSRLRRSFSAGGSSSFKEP